MTPFEELRLWLRRGSTAERGSAALALVIVAVLVIWAVLPTGPTAGPATLASDSGFGFQGTPSSSQPAGGPAPSATAVAGATTPGTTPGTNEPVTTPGNLTPTTGPGGGTGPVQTAPAQTQAPGTGTHTTATARPTATAKPATSAPASATTCPVGATDQGVTATTISIDVLLVDVAGANDVLGVPDAATQQKMNDAYIKHINDTGGLMCRKVVAKYYHDNPLDANGEHSTGLSIVSDKPFAVIGGLYSPQNQTFLVQNKLPSFTQTPLSTGLQKQFYPYLFSPGASSIILNNYALGAKQEGFFNGLGKLGVLQESCFPEYFTQLSAGLAAAGIPSNKIETYNYGCPSSSMPDPSAVAGAVLQFHRDGVTHVMTAGATIGSFTAQAQSQGYKPKYASSDLDGALQLVNSAGFGGNDTNLDGALAITSQQYGALGSHTPLSSSTAECDKIMTAGGAPTAESGDAYAGGVCTQFTFFVDGVTKAPSLTRTAIAVGLDKNGRVELPYGQGPALWNTPGVTYGGQYWRAATFDNSCQCYKVTDPTFHDSF